MKVCFTDAAKGVIQDKKAMAALTKVLARLREETGGTDFPMTRPLVYQWKDTGGESQETLAERYYKEGDLPSFKTRATEAEVPSSFGRFHPMPKM